MMNETLGEFDKEEAEADAVLDAILAANAAAAVFDRNAARIATAHDEIADMLKAVQVEFRSGWMNDHLEAAIKGLVAAQAAIAKAKVLAKPTQS